MSKGRFPKHKGTISDGSIDTADTDNVLLRGAESNLIVVVKLKYKLCYRGHVYSSSISIFKRKEHIF